MADLDAVRAACARRHRPAVGGDAVEPADEGQRHRRAGRARARARRAAGLRQHLRLAGAAAAAGAGRGHRHAFDHQVFRRPQRRARRRAGVRTRGRRLRARRAPPAHHRRGAGAVQRLAHPARLPLAAGADGDALRQCAPRRRIPRRAAAGRTRQLPRPGRRIRATPSPRGRCAISAACSACSCAADARRRWRWPGDCGCSPTPRRWAAANRWSNIAPRSKGANPLSPQNLLRISVGLEHIDDLIADLEQALGAT